MIAPTDRTSAEIRALMEQPGPGVPMTIDEALRQCQEWREKTAAWQGVCDRQNERIASLETERNHYRAELARVTRADAGDGEPTP